MEMVVLKSHDGEKSFVSKRDLKKWTDALRSGKYPQAQGQLQSKDGYCCLGVACELFIPEYKKIKTIDGFLRGSFPKDQTSAPKWLGVISQDYEMRSNDAASLIYLNDSGQVSFEELANRIENMYQL